MFFIFFFQAEDGIRDGTVTGVQTCALPILHPNIHRSRHNRRVRRPTIRRTQGLRQFAGTSSCSPALTELHLLELRSEERRVGKECRSRWWQYHKRRKE